MNGVLDRMVQRARGELPAVEPLVPSQRTALGARASFAVEDLEREVSGGNVQRFDELPPPQRISQISRRTEAHEAVSPVAGAAPAVKKPQPPERLGVNASEDPRAASTRLPQERPEIDVAPQTETARGALNAGIPRQQQSRQDAPGEREPARVAEREIVSRTTSSTPAEAEVRKAALIGSETRREAEGRPGETAKTIEQDQHQRFQAELRPPELAVHAQAPLIEAGEHTEIHISIGSIELHAARTEAKAPLFRPRVTLDEFLRRKPGAGS